MTGIVLTMRLIKKLGTNISYVYGECTPYESLQRLLYYLNLRFNDTDAVINKTESGMFLYLEYHGETYAVRNC